MSGDNINKLFTWFNELGGDASGDRELDGGGLGTRELDGGGSGPSELDGGGLGAREIDCGGLGARELDGGGLGTREVAGVGRGRSGCCCCGTAGKLCGLAVVLCICCSCLVFSAGRKVGLALIADWSCISCLAGKLLKFLGRSTSPICLPRGSLMRTLLATCL